MNLVHQRPEGLLFEFLLGQVLIGLGGEVVRHRVETLQFDQALDDGREDVVAVDRERFCQFDVIVAFVHERFQVDGGHGQVEFFQFDRVETKRSDEVLRVEIVVVIAEEMVLARARGTDGERFEMEEQLEKFRERQRPGARGHQPFGGRLSAVFTVVPHVDAVRGGTLR